MKTQKIRRNVDLSRKALIILQWQAVTAGYGTIKPYLEKYLEEHAVRLLSKNPALSKLITKPNKK
jgi:hypothetical protein